MSRPVVYMTLSLVVGIVIADYLFYDKTEIPTWLDVAAWGFCLCTAVAAVIVYRRAPKAVARTCFTVFTCAFFAVTGFARYAAYASEVRAEWGAMAKPPVNRGNPDEFDYVRWRWIQGPVAQPSQGGAAGLMAAARERALTVRARLVATIGHAGMDSLAQSIVIASTLGDRSQLHADTRDLYAEAGASHLLALSGLHLGIVTGLLLALLNGRLLLSRWRWAAGAAVLLFIWAYAFVAGLPTSLVRAGLMTSLLVVGTLLQRYAAPLHWVALTALLMLLVRPVCLFDVGAQLSFAAVVGIVVLYGAAVRWAFGRWRFLLLRLRRWHMLWPLELLAVSLSAQVATLPIVASCFHRIPLYAPLFSILLIPATTLLVYLTVALLLVSVLPLSQFTVPLLGKALAWLVGLELGAMQLQVNLPGAVVDDFWSRKAYPQLVVYNNRRCPALHLIAAPNRSWLLMPEPDAAREGLRSIASSFWRKRLTSEPQVLVGQSAIVLEGGFKVVMISGSTPALTSTGSPTSVDILWLTSGFEGYDIEPLCRAFRTRLIVLDACMPRSQRRRLRYEAQQAGLRVYDIAEQGALQLKLQH